MATAIAPLNQWATAKGGYVRVRLYTRLSGAVDVYEVYALRGHDLLHTKTFAATEAGLVEARAYANSLWSSL